MPIINGLTDESHPCQALADFMTMKEVAGDIAGKQLTFVGDGNNVARSLLAACSMGRVKFRLAAPTGYQFKPELIERVKNHAKWVDFAQSDNAAEMLRDADFVYTDVWTSMGQESEAEKRNSDLRPYQVNEQLLKLAPSHCKILHCLPARRGMEITDVLWILPQVLSFPKQATECTCKKDFWSGSLNRTGSYNVRFKDVIRN